MDEKTIRKHVLKNAVLHNGKSQAKAIIPKLLGEDPKLKSKLKDLMPKISKIVNDINKMKLDAQKKELLKLDKHALDKKIEVRALPEIEGIKVGECVFRLPPPPEKELHIGHALSYTLNNYYKNKYKGKLMLRIEDTNPDKCKQEFVIGNKNDIKALGITWDSEFFQSDRMSDYYKYCDNLIKAEKAYSCTCSSETMQKNRKKHIRCACADKKVTLHLRDWNKMKYGTFNHGEVVIRIKGDMKSKNSTMWDPVIFRINKTKHYRQGNKYNVWPLYDFTASIDDSKVTHVLRDANWTQRVELQNFIREKVGIKKHPVNVLYSRYEIQGGVTKGRVIRELVEKKVVEDFDDIRLSTVKGLLRRGIVPETFLELLIDVGISKSKTTIPMEKLYSINRRLIEPKASHHFFVENPVLIKVGDEEIYIPKTDAKPGIIRLKHKYSIKLKKDNTAEKLEEEVLKNVIQWVDKNQAVETKILEALPLLDKKGNLNKNSLITHSGVISKEASELPIGTQVQFERFGFCKKEEKKWILSHK